LQPPVGCLVPLLPPLLQEVFAGAAAEFAERLPLLTLGTPLLPVLDLVACMFTMEAFRLTETRSVVWWRTLVVCFVGYKGVASLAWCPL
jgi:hypothetical protein